jgi:hypothetical protein
MKFFQSLVENAKLLLKFLDLPSSSCNFVFAVNFRNYPSLVAPVNEKLSHPKMSEIGKHLVFGDFFPLLYHHVSLETSPYISYVG